MKFGVSNWIFGGEPIEKTLDRLARNGYDGVELIGEPEDYDIPKVKKALQERDLQVLNIGAKCNWPTSERDLANPDPNVRQRTVEYYCRCIDLAHEVGSPYCGFIPSAVGRLGPITSYAEEWQGAVAATGKIAEYAKKSGVVMTIEPLNRYEAFLINTGKQARRFIKDVGSESIRYMLDTYHMNIDEAYMGDAFHEEPDLLRHIHFADSNREGLGCGHINFAEIVAAIKDIQYQGAIVVEVTAPGPNPFQPIKDEWSKSYLEGFTRDSIRLLRSWFK